MGTAYSFFNCRAEQSLLETELEKLSRRIALVRKAELQLTPLERFEYDTSDAGLAEIVALANEAKLRYSMKTLLPGSNWEAAQETAVLLNAAYKNPLLYEEGEEFRAEIVYDIDGMYFQHE